MRLGQGGLPSGLIYGSSYETHQIQLHPGDSVLFATDGLTELRDSGDNDFSWTRLADVWRTSSQTSAEQALDLLFEEAQRFASGAHAHNDDITAVVLKVPN